MRGALAHLVARVVRSYWGGDHSLFVGQVEYARYGEGQPLLFQGGRYQHLLERAPVFSSLPPEILAAITAEGVERTFEAGEFVVREGDPGDELFVILEGEARVERKGSPLATFGAGEFFGEVAVFDGRPRSADVVAATPLRTLAISRELVREALDARAPGRVGDARGARRSPPRRLSGASTSSRGDTGPTDTTTEGSKRNVPLSVRAVWLCRSRCHHFRTTNSGITMVTNVFGCSSSTSRTQAWIGPPIWRYGESSTSSGRSGYRSCQAARTAPLLLVDLDVEAAELVGAQGERVSEALVGGVVGPRHEDDRHVTPALHRPGGDRPGASRARALRIRRGGRRS